jgi:hypothetical protein
MMQEFTVEDLRKVKLTELEIRGLYDLLRNKVKPKRTVQRSVLSSTKYGPCTRSTALNSISIEKAIDYIEHLIKIETKLKRNTKRQTYLKALNKLIKK